MNAGPYQRPRVMALRKTAKVSEPSAGAAPYPSITATPSQSLPVPSVNAAVK